MSIFRVEKNSNYTVISNYHLRDKNLSLKTIGLLSLILSLPEDWDYTQAGLAAICKDGIDSVRSGLNELEKYGYLEKERERDEKGRVRGTNYRIFEIPKSKREAGQETKTYGPNEESPELENPILDSPKLENPILDNPKQDKPTLDEPIWEKTCQLNIDILNTNLLNKDLSNTDIQNTHLPINHEDGLVDGFDDLEKINALREVIKDNVGYALFESKCNALDEQLEADEIDIFDYDTQTLTYNMRTLDQVIDYMLDVLTSLNTEPIKIGDELISRNIVKAKLNKVNFMKIKSVVYELNRNKNIKNPKKYAISMLYNAV